MKLLVVILLLCTDDAMATLFNWVHGALGSNCDTTCVGYGGCTGIAFASSPAGKKSSNLSAFQQICNF